MQLNALLHCEKKFLLTLSWWTSTFFEMQFCDGQRLFCVCCLWSEYSKPHGSTPSVRFHESGRSYTYCYSVIFATVTCDTSRMLTFFCIGSVNQSPVGHSTLTGWLHDVTVNHQKFVMRIECGLKWCALRKKLIAYRSALQRMVVWFETGLPTWTLVLDRTLVLNFSLSSKFGCGLQFKTKA